MSAWIRQDVKQVAKVGKDKASYYVHWLEPGRRQKCKSCGPGPEGLRQAKKLRRRLEEKELAEAAKSMEIGAGRFEGIAPEQLDILDGARLVYFLEAVGLDRVKIGWTNKLKRRLGGLQTASPVRLKLLAALPGSRKDEVAFHRKYKAFRLHGEWFQLTKRLRLDVANLREMDRINRVNRRIRANTGEPPPDELSDNNGAPETTPEVIVD
jgi:hypothetical protein